MPESLAAGLLLVVVVVVVVVEAGVVAIVEAVFSIISLFSSAIATM